MNPSVEINRPRRRVVWAGAGVLVLMMVLLGWSWRVLRGPQHAGRTVFEWLEEGSRKGDREGMEEALIAMGPRAVPSLVQLLSLQDTNEVFQVIGLINQVPGLSFDRVHPRLLRSWAVEALGMLGTQACAAVPALTNALTANDPYIIDQILRTLGEMGPAAAKAVPALEALAESSSQDRQACFGALANIDPERTLERLEQAIVTEYDPMQRMTLIRLQRRLQWSLKNASRLGLEGDVRTAPTLKSVLLLQDPHFRRGVRVLDPRPGGRNVLQDLEVAEGGDSPVWFLAQWNSKRSLTRADRSLMSGGAIAYTNGLKTVQFLSGDSRDGDLELGVDGLEEWDHQWRIDAETPWPHLLVEQDIGSPSLEAMLGLKLGLDVQIVENRRSRLSGRSSDLHCAQLQLVMTVQDRDPQSPGFGDFLWFALPLFDDRYSIPPPHMAPDTADPSAKFIYNPGGSWYSYQDSRMRYGLRSYNGWSRFQGDVYPLILDAVRMAWRRGYLPHSKDENDLRITSVNLGWEVTGLNQVRARFRNLSLEAWVEKD